MYRRAQDGPEPFNFEEIDDCNFASEEQDSWSNSTFVSNDSNSYNLEFNLEYNLVLKNNNQLPDDYQLSTAASLSSSDSPSTAVGLSSLDSIASSSENLPVVQRLQKKIMKKIIAEGRQDTLLTSSPKEAVANQLSPEEEKKKGEKQERNKEAARRSRQKKKDDEDKLKMTNKKLTAKQEELKREVAHFQCLNHKFQEFLANHECVIPPQQDNGDRMCLETGRNKVWDDDYDSCCDDSCISQVLELTDFYDAPLPVSQGSKSQRIHAILYGLQDGQQSAIVTSGTVYAPVGYNGIQESSPNSLCSLANPGKSETAAGAFSIQETSLNSCYSVANSGKLHSGTGAFGSPGTSQGTFYNGANPQGYKTGAMACDGKFSEKVDTTTEICNLPYMGTYHLPPLTDVVTQTNNSSVSLTKPWKSNMTNAWATGEGNQSEEEEARRVVQGLSPPPEKKFRRE